MRRCALGKDTLHLFSIGAKLSTRCEGNKKTCKPNPKKMLCVGVVRHRMSGSYERTSNRRHSSRKGLLFLVLAIIKMKQAIRGFLF